MKNHKILILRSKFHNFYFWSDFNECGMFRRFQKYIQNCSMMNIAESPCLMSIFAIWGSGVQANCLRLVEPSLCLCKGKGADQGFFSLVWLPHSWKLQHIFSSSMLHINKENWRGCLHVNALGLFLNLYWNSVMKGWWIIIRIKHKYCQNPNSTTT